MKKTVLLLDDQKDFQDIYEEYFLSLDVVSDVFLIKAFDLDDAQMKLKENDLKISDVDLIFSDYFMSPNSGLEIVKRCRNQGYDKLVIFCSSKTNLDEMIGSRFDNYICLNKLNLDSEMGKTQSIIKTMLN